MAGVKRPPRPPVQYVQTADGVRIAYYVIGSGPPIVHMPGWPYQHLHDEWTSSWASGIDALAAYRTVIRFDGRACGMSQRDVADISFEARMLDLEAIVERSVESPFDIMAVAHSVPLAIAYAAAHPDRVKRMILSSGSARAADMFTPQ